MERVKSFFEATRTYLREVVGELKKVVWPAKERTAKLTGVVIGMVALIAGYLFILDLPLGYAISEFLGR